jgi:hypothetical protein
MKKAYRPVVLILFGMAALAGSSRASAQSGGAPPRPDHVVIVIEENHAYSEIIGNSSAPYINSLASQGALFTSSYAITHPSQPNYIALFSGSTQGCTDDNVPAAGTPWSAPNLGSELTGAGFTFGGYSEDMPSVGFTGPWNAGYARKHNPWVDFSNVPAASNMPLTSFPAPGAYDTLPTVSIVVPNVTDDMHDGSVSLGDTWLKNNLDAYIQWAKTHNSLFILTWDEDDGSPTNQIATLFVGPMVKPGTYSQTINHYSVLRTLEDMYGTGHAGAAATAAPITGVWDSAATPPPPTGGGGGSSGAGSDGGGGGHHCGALGLDAALLLGLSLLGFRCRRKI